jgi:hypothetical protein
MASRYTFCRVNVVSYGGEMFNPQMWELVFTAVNSIGMTSKNSWNKAQNFMEHE